jgi:DNA-binding SARP family transcriptional activator
MEAYARAALGIGGTELPAAIRVARALVEGEPYRESGYLLLMEGLAREGNKAEGLRVYEKLRRRLRNELGVSPGEELQELHRQLLH